MPITRIASVAGDSRSYAHVMRAVLGGLGDDEVESMVNDYLNTKTDLSISAADIGLATLLDDQSLWDDVFNTARRHAEAFVDEQLPNYLAEYGLG